MNKQYQAKRRQSRLARVERKCDRILAELLILRQQLSRRPNDIDVAIERLHNQARIMRQQCEKERSEVRKMLLSERPDL